MGESKKSENGFENEQRSYSEQRIREITFAYYFQPHIRKALFEFSKNRESVPRYYESFGKRPDSFQYESDILEQVKKGATSFHSSEELWSDPLQLSTDLPKQEIDSLRMGWDLLLDIDSPYLEYSKIYAELIIEALKFHNIENLSIKFSGNKGFHILVPWKAFPEEVYGQKTKDMFPEWPRMICSYLADITQSKLADKIFENESLKEIAKKTGKSEKELIINECLSCNRPAIKKNQVTWICINCKNIGEVIRIETNRKIPRCPECRKPLFEKSRKEILFCEYCNSTSVKNPGMFAKTREKTESLIEADLILVASRHLFRMPYSLHEKTGLSSLVLDKEKIINFQMTDAKPLKVKIKNFYPAPKKNEARELLLQALDWYEQRKKQEKEIDGIRKDAYPGISKKGDYKNIVIENPNENIFPPQIKLLLQGVKQDGRKRALFILLSFFKSLGVSDSEIEKRVFQWNDKNYLPLKKGYIISQLSWYRKNTARLPPNFNNPIYKDLGVDKPDSLSMQTKNPVNYAIKRYFEMQRK